MKLAFLLDLGFYYLGIASQPFKRGKIGLTEPVFTTAPSVPFFHLMRTHNRRFVSIARARRARNCGGQTNNGRRFMFSGYTAARQEFVKADRESALAAWARLELTEGWRSWFGNPAPATLSFKTLKARSGDYRKSCGIADKSRPRLPFRISSWGGDSSRRRLQLPSERGPNLFSKQSAGSR